MHALLLLLVLGARADDGVAAPDPAQVQADREWAVATSRMLGAAGTVRDRAWRLKQAAATVQASGRMGAMSALASDGREVHQAVASAVLAGEVMAEKAGGAVP